MSNLDHIYFAHQQRAALISGEDPDGNTIPGPPVNLQVGAAAVSGTNPVPIGAGTLTKTVATGVGAITASAAITADARLAYVALHFSAAPTTSQDLIVTLNSVDGAAYDTVLATIDPSLASVTDFLYEPEGDLFLFSGDAIDVTFTNTDGVTYGVRIVTVAV